MAGYVYKPKYKDRRTGEMRESKTWRIGYSINGKKYTESAKTEFKREAEQFLAERLADRSNGGPAARDLSRVAYDDLEKMLLTDYERNNRKSIDTLGYTLRPLREAFGGYPVPTIDEMAVDAYVEQRLRAGYANATVNLELAALKRMFTLGYKRRIVGRVPAFPTLELDNARKGFFEERELQAVLAVVQPELRAVLEVAYITGWRKSELLSRGWRHVDMDAGWMRLEPGETKNGKGRQFPLTDRLRRVLEQHEAVRVHLEKKHSRIIPDLFFHYDGPCEGQPITTLQKAWKKARKAAGLWNPGTDQHRIFHDFRRTAVRNLIRAGVPEKVSMELCGWETRSVFDRYNIVDEADLSRAGEMLNRAGARL